MAGFMGAVAVTAAAVLVLPGSVRAEDCLTDWGMAGQIVRKRPTNAPGVLAHHLQHPSEEVMTVMTTVIALSPGTMTVDTSRDSSVVYVHFLLLLDVAAARDSLVRLERLVVGAIGPDHLRPDGPPGPEELT